MSIALPHAAHAWKQRYRLRASALAGRAGKTGERRGTKPSIGELRQVKQRLGALEQLDFTAVDAETAHRELGKLVGPQVRRILAHKLDRLAGDQYAGWANEATNAYRALVEKAGSPAISTPVRTALRHYLTCLSAWAEGAGLDHFDHPRLAEYTAGSLRLSSTALAWLLQDETVGCLTGLLREEDGSVVLWHTEEDREETPGSHFDRLRVVSFRVGDQGCTTDAHAFVYPYLLPGPAFAWRDDGYLQAVDSLFIEPASPGSPGLLANAATWVLLWLGPTLPAEETLRQLGPFADGYAANIAYPQADGVVAQNHEFAGDRILSHPLSCQQNSYLLQVNVGSHTDSRQLRDLECVSPRERRAYLRRLQRMRRLLPRPRPSGASGESTVELVCEALASRVDPEWSYANPDVKAFFVARVTPADLEIRIGPGPVLPDEAPVAMHILTGRGDGVTRGRGDTGSEW